MKDAFQPFEFIAIIVPGAVISFGALLVFPDLQTYIATTEGTTIGGLGLFLILSFVAGHLVQGIGDLIEPLFWSVFGGMPTTWVLAPTQSLLDPLQAEKLFEKIRGIYPSFTPSTEDSEHWFIKTREMYGRTADAKKVERVDAFNRTYGLLLGIGTSFLLCGVFAVWLRPMDWQLWLGLLIGSVLAFARMYRFSKHYARELFVRYLST